MDIATLNDLHENVQLAYIDVRDDDVVIDGSFTHSEAHRLGLALIDPIPMILHCPKCGTQHIDAPEPMNYKAEADNCSVVENHWCNPPHRSHLCHNCGHIWRPADVSTTGVEKIETRGKNDSPTVSPHYAYRDAQRLRKLINSCGYVQNSSEVEVRLRQDDATRECGIKVGWDDTIWAESFRTAIDKLPEPE